MIRVTPLTTETPAIRRLQKQTLPQDAPLKHEKGTKWWLATVDGEPAGFAAMTLMGRRTGYLARAGVLAAHRGLGLQKMLIQARVAEAKRLGWSDVVSDTVPLNAPSANSLIACGFKVYAPRRPWRVSGTCYWRLHLQ